MANVLLHLEQRKKQLQIEAERAGEDADGEDDTLGVPKPAFVEGYPSRHIAPFPPETPGEPILFLPAAPFEGANEVMERI